MHLLPQITVIICTHNPKTHYLDRVLDALKGQTLPLSNWELLLIDNASNQPLADKVDLSWHPQARHIYEPKLGLTHARLCGIHHAQGDTLVFVDDDNVLDQDYLATCLQICKDFPFLGAWGGQAFPDFEESPPEWTRPFWGRLALREFQQDRWSNLPHLDETTPYGAGLCIRKSIAEHYAEVVRHDPRRVKLGRTGTALAACEDVDLAYTACDLGLGTGVFTALKLLHLIPTNRLQETYLLRLEEGVAYSGAILEFCRGKPKIPVPHSWRSRLLNFVRDRFLDARDRNFKAAYARGVSLASQEIASLGDSHMYIGK